IAVVGRRLLALLGAGRWHHHLAGAGRAAHHRPGLAAGDAHQLIAIGAAETDRHERNLGWFLPARVTADLLVLSRVGRPSSTPALLTPPDGDNESCTAGEVIGVPAPFVGCLAGAREREGFACRSAHPSPPSC